MHLNPQQIKQKYKEIKEWLKKSDEERAKEIKIITRERFKEIDTP